MKPATGYMVVSSQGNLAPFYGWSRTKKELLAAFERNGWTLCAGMKIVKVEIVEWADKWKRAQET